MLCISSLSQLFTVPDPTGLWLRQLLAAVLKLALEVMAGGVQGEEEWCIWLTCHPTQPGALPASLALGKHSSCITRQDMTCRWEPQPHGQYCTTPGLCTDAGTCNPNLGGAPDPGSHLGVVGDRVEVAAGGG